MVLTRENIKRKIENGFIFSNNSGEAFEEKKYSDFLQSVFPENASEQPNFSTEDLSKYQYTIATASLCTRRGSLCTRRGSPIKTSIKSLSVLIKKPNEQLNGILMQF